MKGNIQVDLKLVGPQQQLLLSAQEGQRISHVVAELKTKLMAIMTDDIQDPLSKDIQGDWLEEQLSEDEAKAPKTVQRKQRNKRKARDS